MSTAQRCSIPLTVFQPISAEMIDFSLLGPFGAFLYSARLLYGSPERVSNHQEGRS